MNCGGKQAFRYKIRDNSQRKLARINCSSCDYRMRPLLENHYSPFLRRYLAFPSQSLAFTDSSLCFQKRRYVTIRLTTAFSVFGIGYNGWQCCWTRDKAIVTVTVDAVTTRPGTSIDICICILVLTQVIWETNRQQIGTEKICFDRKWVSLEKKPFPPLLMWCLILLYFP